ncbi:MAG: DNA repair exonuclease [Candidatus Desulfofervidaceae bacterium]|nr:DNA repair exonuclease [Candidatus Desulfofervidaceae bacterium]
MRLLHTADLHLGRKGREEDIWKQWEKIITVAQKEGVNVLVIAGDVFDDGRAEKEVKEKFCRSLERLTREGMTVFIIPGNHDLRRGNALAGINLPGVKVVFDYMVVTLGKVTLHLFPFSPQLDGPRMVQLRKDAAGEYQIGVCHASYVALPDVFRDLGESQAIHCPLVSEDIVALDFDYLALGHYHNAKSWQVGKTHCAYTGSIEPLSFKETAPRQIFVIECGHSLDIKLIEIGCQRPYLSYQWQLGVDVEEKDIEQQLATLAQRLSPCFLRLTLRGLVKNKLFLKDVILRAQELFQSQGIAVNFFDETVDLTWVKEHRLSRLFYEICQERAEEDQILWQRVFYRGISLLKQVEDVD